MARSADATLATTCVGRQWSSTPCNPILCMGCLGHGAQQQRCTIRIADRTRCAKLKAWPQPPRAHVQTFGLGKLRGVGPKRNGMSAEATYPVPNSKRKCWARLGKAKPCPRILRHFDTTPRATWRPDDDRTHCCDGDASERRSARGPPDRSHAQACGATSPDIGPAPGKRQMRSRAARLTHLLQSAGARRQGYAALRVEGPCGA